ncbi:hypothetical protein ASZ90_003854 [hydrocarbon metagenome]|uniref:Uncharacterized protein n=1 Tax=hydrocarbon metagenome TaxID=938273 RepID=A0A0W8FZQ5_9ZZZZ
MNLKLKEIKDIVAQSCVTIILNTHRTSPDNKKDTLTLKNLIKEAEERLLADESKRDAKALVKRLRDLESEIDHKYNLESLILFVNENIAEYTQLPIAVEDRVVIDHTFATRDLVRALHFETNYYVLVLSQQKVRLIEAFNDKVVAENENPFPIENEQFYSTQKVEISNASRQTNLVAEFFNRVDKEVNKIRKENPLPVLICTEQGNYHEYLKIADQKQSIFDTYLNKNRVNEKAHAIVTEAWKIVKEYTIEKNNIRKAELQKAVSQNKFLSDTNEIWQAIKQGRIQTIFIEQGKFQPAIWENDQIQYVSDNLRDKKEVVDDIYDELIEVNMNYGGDVVFLPKGELKDFNGFGAITRY